MVMKAVFELSEQKEEVLGLLSKLLSSDTVEVRCQQDNSEGQFDFSVNTKITDSNREAVKALTALSVDHAM